MLEEDMKKAAADIIRDHGVDVDYLTVVEALSWWDKFTQQWRGPTEITLEGVWNLIGKAKVEVTWEK